MLGRPGHPVFTRFAPIGAPNRDRDPVPETAPAGPQPDDADRPAEAGDRDARAVPSPGRAA